MSPSEDTKVCPYCAETIKAEAIVCRYCGRDLQPKDVVALTTPQQTQQPSLTPETTKKKKGNSCLVVFLVVGGLFLAVVMCTSASRTGTNNARTISSARSSPTPTMTIAELRNEAVAIPFDELARNTEKYNGKLGEFSGKVIQVIEDGDEAQLRVNIDDELNQTVFVFYPGYGGARVLDGDTVKMVAKVDGRITYEAVLGNEVTLPALTAIWLEVQSE